MTPSVTPADGARTPSEPADPAKPAEPTQPTPPPSVAEEAALLVDLLSRRGWSGPARSHPAHEDARRHDDARSSGDGPADDATPTGDDTRASACTCGGTTPAACRVCPVCQLIAFVQQVNPDTIEKVADVVGFAATALRDLASAQRERRAGPDADDHRPGGTA